MAAEDARPASLEEMRTRAAQKALRPEEPVEPLVREKSPPLEPYGQSPEAVKAPAPQKEGGFGFELGPKPAEMAGSYHVTRSKPLAGMEPGGDREVTITTPYGEERLEVGSRLRQYPGHKVTDIRRIPNPSGVGKSWAAQIEPPPGSGASPYFLTSQDPKAPVVFQPSEPGKRFVMPTSTLKRDPGPAFEPPLQPPQGWGKMPRGWGPEVARQWVSGDLTDEEESGLQALAQLTASRVKEMQEKYPDWGGSYSGAPWTDPQGAFEKAHPDWMQIEERRLKTEREK